MRGKRYTLIGLAFYLTYIGGSSYYALSFPIRVLHHVVITLLLSIWLIGRLRRGRGLPESGFNTVLYAALAWWGITALLGLSPRMSLEWLWFGLIHTLFFLYLVEQIRRGYQRPVMEAVFFMAMGVLLLSGLELGSWFFGWELIPGTEVGWIVTGHLPRLTDIPQIALPMAVSTLVAGYTAPLVIVAGVWAATTRQHAYKVILGLLAMLLAGVLLFTSSRGGALSIGAALGALLLMRLVQSPRVRALVPPRVLVMGVGGLIVAALIAVVVISLPNSNSISNRDRLIMWRSAVTLVGQDPLTGVGSGQFGRAFRTLRDPFVAQDKLASAHNFYLNTLAETGIPGLLLAAALAALVVRQGWQHWRTTPNPGTRQRIEGVFAALIGLSVHSVVDVFTITPIVLLVAALVAYAITPQPASRLDPVPPGARAPAWIALLLVVSYGAWLLLQDMAQSFYMRSWQTSDPTQALADVRLAQTLDPALTLYRLHEAYLIGETDTPQAGIAAYEMALALEPTWDVGWLNLAALQLGQNDRDGAIRSLQAAETLKIDNGAGLFLADLRPADECLTHVTPLLQTLTVLPLHRSWSSLPCRREALQAYWPLLPLDWRYRVQAAHFTSLLPTLLPAAPSSAADWWVVGEYALTVEKGAAKAVNAFSQAIQLAPREGDYYASRARALLLTNPAAARHDLDLARLYGTRHEYPNAIEVAITDDPRRKERLQLLALPQRSAPQEFAAVLYGRPAVFDVTPAMRIPLYDAAALQPWRVLAQQAAAEGDASFAAALQELIRQYDPLGPRP